MLYRTCLLFLLFCCSQSKAEENEPGSGKGMLMKTGSKLKCICRGLHLPEYSKGTKDYYFQRYPSGKFERMDNYESTKLKGNQKKCSCFEYSEQYRKNSGDSVIYVQDDSRQIDKYDVTTDRPSASEVGQVEYNSGYRYPMSGKSKFSSVTQRPLGYPINHQEDIEKHLHRVTGHSLASDFTYRYPIFGKNSDSFMASDYLIKENGKMGTRRYGRISPLTDRPENSEETVHSIINGEGPSTDGNNDKKYPNDDANGWRKGKSVNLDKSVPLMRQKRKAEFGQHEKAKKTLDYVSSGAAWVDKSERTLDESISGEDLKEISRQIKPLLRQKRKSELDKSNGAKMNLEESAKDYVNSVIKQAESIVAYNSNRSAEVLEKIGFGLGVASEVVQQASNQAGSMMGGKMAQGILNQVSGGLIIASNAASTIAEQKRSEGRRRKRSMDTSDSETFDNSTKPRIAADNIIRMLKKSAQKLRRTTTKKTTVPNHSSSLSTRFSAGLR